MMYQHEGIHHRTKNVVARGHIMTCLNVTPAVQHSAWSSEYWSWALIRGESFPHSLFLLTKDSQGIRLC